MLYRARAAFRAPVGRSCGRDERHARAGRALDALERHGTFAAAAAALRKGHTAVLYAIRTLEAQTELALLDRAGYRTRLSPAGQRVLGECRKLLAAERELVAVCQEIRTGWEPALRIVCDGLFPMEPIIAVVGRLTAARAPTRLGVYAEFLAGVEATFVRDSADIMISVLPPTTVALEAVPLRKIRAHLVAHRDHPLATRARAATAEELAAHVLLTVRGSDPRLQLSTSGLDHASTVQLNDFLAKKAAILSGVGFGWMPGYLITRELRAGTLRPVRFHGSVTHLFRPHLYYRAGPKLGRAGQTLVAALRKDTAAGDDARG